MALKECVFLKVKDIAKELNTSRSHVYRLIEAGRLMAINIGVLPNKPVYRVKREDFNAFQTASGNHDEAV